MSLPLARTAGEGGTRVSGRVRVIGANLGRDAQSSPSLPHWGGEGRGEVGNAPIRPIDLFGTAKDAKDTKDTKDTEFEIPRRSRSKRMSGMFIRRFRR